jgi:hypothetical protein
LSVKYYIRPRAEENIKLWQGPFDTAKLKELADRRMFSKELHEYSEDRLNWISARQIWPVLFPKAVRSLSSGSPMPLGGTSRAETIPLAPSGSSSPKRETPEDAEDWYCAVDGVQQGPFTLAQIRSYIVDSKVQPSDLVWCPAFGDNWVEAQTIPELFQHVGSGTRSTSAGNAIKPPPLALVSLICGVLGLTCLFGIGGILAVISGHVALSEFARLPSKEGRWMAITGLVLGYVSIALSFISLAVVLLLRHV